MLGNHRAQITATGFSTASATSGPSERVLGKEGGAHEAAAKIREANNEFLGEGIGAYKP